MSLYSDFFYSKQLEIIFSDENTVQAMLDFESNLAQIQAENGLFDLEFAQIISEKANHQFIDFEKLKSAINQSGNVAIPLVKQLTQLVYNQSIEALKYVHLGATSQDVVDTGLVLQLKKTIDFFEEKLTVLEFKLIEITKRHRLTFMVGRTLLQQAKPITFGLKTALYLEAISRSKSRILSVNNQVLHLQLAGAVGSQNQFINSKIKTDLAQKLSLNVSNSWHTNRDNLAEFASVLGILNGSLAKIAKDIVLLMQTEVAEVFEGAETGKGGSSTMPHKRNPVTSTVILANANRVPNLVATMLLAMPQEHERSAGLWHSEWDVLTEICKLTGGSLEKAIDLMANLEVDSERMLQNIELTKGLIYAENISLTLASKIGKDAAHQMVEKACKTAILEGKHLKEILKNTEIIDLDEHFKPENAIGFSIEIIDSILAKYA
jgi:3-carboxy-cis,cis-muconate cycloisomerase